MRVNIPSDMEDYLFDLIDLLYNKGYFSFYENAEKYIDNFFNNIRNELPLKLKNKAPKYFNSNSKNLFYVFYKPNKHTIWYIFFQIKDGCYLIKHITNNHISGAHIRGLKGR